MIVDEVLGAAECDGKPFGCPFHGVIKNSVLSLPNGGQKAFRQPVGAVHEESGRVLRIGPSWARGAANLTAVELNQLTLEGKSWRREAVLSGSNSQLHGQELGHDCWLWTEAEGKVWLVDPRELLALDPVTSGGLTVSLYLTRFGWLGDLPASEESSKVLKISLPDDLGQSTQYPNLSGRYVNGYWRPYNGALQNSVSFRLQDTRRADGSVALFGAVCTSANNRAQQYNVVSVFSIDLNAASFIKLVGREAMWVQEVDAQSRTGTIPMNVSVNLATTSFSGGCSTKEDSVEIQEYVITKTSDPNGWHWNGNYQFSSNTEGKYLLGAAFDSNDEPAIIWGKVIENVTESASGVLSISGQNVITGHVLIDSDGNCSIGSTTEDKSAVADTVGNHDATRVCTVQILCGSQVVESRMSTSIFSQQYMAHTDPDGNNSATSFSSWSVLGWDKQNYAYDSSLSGDDLKNPYVKSDFGSVYFDIFDGPVLDHFDEFAKANIDPVSTSLTTIEPFCLGPGRFCLRIAKIADDTVFIGDTRARNVTYDQFCTAEGSLPLPPHERIEYQFMKTAYYYTWSISADPVFCSGIYLGDCCVSDFPCAVV